MIVLAIVMLGVFVLTLAFPLLDVCISNRAAKEITEYVFPKELIDRDHGEVKGEEMQIDRISAQYRGSIRMACGKVITKEQLEEKKKIEYSILLP